MPERADERTDAREDATVVPLPVRTDLLPALLVPDLLPPPPPPPLPSGAADELSAVKCASFELVYVCE